MKEAEKEKKKYKNSFFLFSIIEFLKDKKAIKTKEVKSNKTSFYSLLL